MCSYFVHMFVSEALEITCSWSWALFYGILTDVTVFQVSFPYVLYKYSHYRVWFLSSHCIDTLGALRAPRSSSTFSSPQGSKSMQDHGLSCCGQSCVWELRGAMLEAPLQSSPFVLVFAMVYMNCRQFPKSVVVVPILPLGWWEGAAEHGGAPLGVWSALPTAQGDSQAWQLPQGPSRSALANSTPEVQLAPHVCSHQHACSVWPLNSI